MAGLLRSLLTAFVYVCVATILAQVTGAVVLWATGKMDKKRVFRILAAVYGVDLSSAEDQSDEATTEEGAKNVAYEAIVERRVMKALDLDLREQALSNGIDNLRRLQDNLTEKRARYERVKDDFDAELKRLQNNFQKDGLIELQATLEVMHPKQAKNQLLRMIDDDAMDHVVGTLKTMPLDRRKKILAEFKTDEESEKLADILRQIRLADNEAIKNTQEKIGASQP